MALAAIARQTTGFEDDVSTQPETRGVDDTAMDMIEIDDSNSDDESNGGNEEMPILRMKYEDDSSDDEDSDSDDESYDGNEGMSILRTKYEDDSSDDDSDGEDKSEEAEEEVETS